MRPPEAKTGTEQIPAPADLLRRLVIDATIETVSTWGVLDVRDKTKEVPVGAGKGMKSLQLFDQIEKRVREKLRQFEQKNGFSIGINLVGIERIGDPEVPAAVRPAFDMFQQAESQKERLTDEGTEKANSVKASARGRKAEIIAEAKAYKSRIQNIARADAQMLTQLSRVYKESPVKASILREWHYQRMLEELLGEARGSFVLHETKDETSRELWLQMSQPPKPEKKEKSGEGPEE
jgi:regulator of protease activity HflC (stomatin/prohibitin superfamily)